MRGEKNRMVVMPASGENPPVAKGGSLPAEKKQKVEIRLEGRGQKSEIGKYANQLSKRLALPVQENWRNARQYDKPARPVSDLRPLKSDL